MHHPTDRISHTTAFVTPVVEHWLEREIAQWVLHIAFNWLIVDINYTWEIPDVLGVAITIWKHAKITQRGYPSQWTTDLVICQWAGRSWVHISVPAPTKSGFIKVRRSVYFHYILFFLTSI